MAFVFCSDWRRLVSSPALSSISLIGTRRAKMVATFMVAIPLSGILGGPLSGFIMQFFAGVHGWPGWKWLFLLEAVPTLLVGVATLFYLDSGIRHAKWLNEEEK